MKFKVIRKNSFPYNPKFKKKNYQISKKIYYKSWNIYIWYISYIKNILVLDLGFGAKK